MAMQKRTMMLASASYLLLLLLSSLPMIASQQQQQQQQGDVVEDPAAAAASTAVAVLPHVEVDPAASCVMGRHPFDPFRHKRKYHVRVHAIRGFDAAMREYNLTFSEYLTETAGKRFDPPIEFTMDPISFEGMNDAIENDEMDLFYANPGIYSCIGVEHGASPVVTIVSKLEVRQHVYELDVFGGVMFTRADNDEINSMQDYKDKVIGAGSIAQIMAAQVQFWVMQRAGISYVNDPAQVVFTYNQDLVVKGVLNGDFDVGFVRTDTIERSVDENGKPIDTSLFKVIDPKIYVLDDGELFPFLHSTPIYPEWPVAAMTTVAKDVQMEVQDALLDIGEHAKIGQKLVECREKFGASACNNMMFPDDFLDPGQEARCDTTRKVAELAYHATTAGRFAGFRTPRSYFQVRTMHEETNILMKDERGDYKCTRAETVHEAVTCPPGHYKRPKEEFERGCIEAGYECKEGFDCFCRPCVKAHEVNVYSHVPGEEDPHLEGNFDEDSEGCDKMSLCGEVQQAHTITFRAFDNLRRENPKVEVVLHVGDKPKWLPVKRLNGTYAYEFEINEKTVGVEIFEVFVDDVQIPTSPIRVDITERDCSEEYGLKSNLVANGEGICVCNRESYKMGGRCVKSPYVFVIIFGSIFVFLLFVLTIYLNNKRKQSDSVWHVNVDELVFDEPPKVIGQGAFGVVILGEYRGTQVAVKRVLPPNVRPRRGSMKSSFHEGEGTESKKKGYKKKRSSASASDHDDDDHEDHHDIENPPTESKKTTKTAKTDSLVISNSGSRSGSVGSLDDIINRSSGDHKFDSILRILDTSTTGSASFVGRTTSVVYDWLPSFMRFDEQSRVRREFIVEMRLLSRLRHPCITTVMGAVIAPRVDPMLVMEYMEYGSLYDLLSNETMYTGGETILQIVRDVAQGIRFLHASKPPILHGDLKAKNILIDSRFRAKVADFGLSNFKVGHGHHRIQGTPYYLAPEYLRRKTDFNAPCDMYAMGMILYEIYERKEPFSGEDPRKILPKVCHPRINLRPAVPESCPPKMVDIMKKLWSANPFFRPTAKDIDFILMDMSSTDAEPLEATKNMKAFKDMIVKPEKTAKELLYEVFPKHVADALNAGQRVEPESHEMVTVVFSEIVNYDLLCSAADASPMAISQMLDRLYQVFDELSKKHDVFKVETIGDNYMGVTNLDGKSDETHVKNVAEFAIEAIDCASQILIDEQHPERGYIQIRVGFHSGPVVSNVIGTLNQRYGLFGDTVNTASRMETNSSTNKILCSQISAKLLEEQAPHIPLRRRGKVNVKGKGTMITYWVGGTDAIKDEDGGNRRPTM